VADPSFRDELREAAEALDRLGRSEG